MTNIIDDGLNPKLVRNSRFEGIFEIPVIEKENEIVIPTSLIPFSQRNKSSNKCEFIHFYEFDSNFKEAIYNIDCYIEELREFAGVIAPDCSLYRDMPLMAQLTNIYMNRAIGSYLQSKGIKVIPNVRWSDERTFTTVELPEKVAFVGIPKQSIVSIGTYGCMKNKVNREYFKNGLIAMLNELEPKVVIVYGSMPKSVFSDLKERTQFILFPDWISTKRKKAS